MALIRFAEGQQRSGSTGGSVYSHNRFGQYIRSRSTPVNPNTARQVEARNITRALSIAWQNVLTQAQRDGWDVYAANVSWVNKFGDTVNLTGLNHYIRSNAPRLASLVDLARIDNAPTTYTLATAELALACTASEATQDVTCGFDDTADWAAEVGAFQAFSIGLPKNAGITFFGGPYRVGGSFLGVAVPAGPEVIASPFPFAEDNRIWVRSRIGRADGRLSQFAEVNFLGDA